MSEWNKTVQGNEFKSLSMTNAELVSRALEHAPISFGTPAPDKLALAVEALEDLASEKSPLDEVQMPFVVRLSKDHVRRVRIATEALAAIKAST